MKEEKPYCRQDKYEQSGASDLNFLVFAFHIHRSSLYNRPSVIKAEEEAKTGQIAEQLLYWLKIVIPKNIENAVNSVSNIFLIL